MSKEPLVLQRTLKEYDSPVGLKDPAMGIRFDTGEKYWVEFAVCWECGKPNDMANCQPCSTCFKSGWAKAMEGLAPAPIAPEKRKAAIQNLLWLMETPNA